MLNNISFYMIGGKPLIMYGGIIVLLLMLATATLGAMVLKGKIQFKYHKAMAISTIIAGLLHGILGMLSFF
ncbi:MAG: hypothetical protein AABX27_03205 [Nanoarchaeota archaeon]